MSDPGFRYLNLENMWPDFTLTGIARRSDGALTLARVPKLEGTITTLPPITAFSGPMGVGVDTGGNLYIADPANHRILRWDACSGETMPLPCFGGEGSLPGQLREPRGVLVGPRGALYVADSGNHRIQIIDLRTLQLRAIWGQSDPYLDPQPGDAPGQLNTPWDIAADRAGYLYVVDYGNRRVQKYTPDGRVVVAFWQTLQAQLVTPEEPAYIATGFLDGEERLIVLDWHTHTLLVYRTDGTYDDVASLRWKNLTLEQPAGVVFANDTLYIGDAATQQVLVFDLQGHFIGEVQGYHGPVAGLSLDHQGRLLIHPGSGAVASLLADQAYVETGTFVAGPFTASTSPTRWYRLQIMADELANTAHIRIYTLSSAQGSALLPLPSQTPDAATTTALTTTGIWRPAPRDQLDLLVLNEPSHSLWIGAVFEGDGGNSPVLHQIRLEFAHEGWLRYLPAIYQRDAANHVLLERALALFESQLVDFERQIEDLPLRFDPEAAPDQSDSSWLAWLGDWLDFDLDETWSDEQRRQALAQAFSVYDRRGTIEGLRQQIKLYTGADALIEEPTSFAGFWSLGETSILGFDMMLAPAHPQGAVVDTTATLDQSYLINEEDYGAALFEDVAHQFCVQLYAADLVNPIIQEKVRQVLEREKPAHMTYHLCLIEPRMRVGFQARVGIDTIVGGVRPNLILDAPHQLGLDTVLPESPDQPLGGTIGRGARVGMRTRLS